MNEELNIETLCEEEIQSLLIELKRVEIGSKEYESMINAIGKLSGNYTDILKTKGELDLKKLQIESDVVNNQVKTILEKRNNRAKNWIQLALGLSSLGVGSFWAYQTFKFDETGSITSTLGKQFVNSVTKFKFWN